MLLVEEYFKHYPARKKVAEALVRYGIRVRHGKTYCGNVEVPISELARVIGVNRKIIYHTVEMVERHNALRLFFEKLEPELRIEEIAPMMNWEVLEVELDENAHKEATARILEILSKEKGRLISAHLRNLYGETPRLSVVVDRPLRSETIARIKDVPGAKKLLLRTPEKDKLRLVCTFCEVEYCPRRLERGDVYED
ncbi:regulator of amino acid metabolism, contains ACT domain protein [Thermococcus sp. Bubb.Bath]|uniref:regulator of amino acid metabolism, contains ACT domain protein n=1 Tax=Thermococcus sp. Bubb.Bath TaxID=1638242 RepID=UPI00143BD60F|nr:regulator of amino acid metabolism, contains ACT domain protein [Thermococcus sp. Bubb.Bath]NJF24628.1 regulator of amino acid metabolism, contains ACT domain protein [Thermococcus sp. Bubb.Bath]